MSQPTQSPSTSSAKAHWDKFLVCGLGHLGQQCIIALKKFGVVVSAIEKQMPTEWELPSVAEILDELIIGDCRQPQILDRAGITVCRTVLIVTSNEEVNAHTALVVRQLNQNARIILRSSAKNLNDLLSDTLGNCFAGEPTEMTASAFGLAGLGEGILGFFNLDEQSIQIIAHKLKNNDPWCQRYLHELQTKKRCILFHLSNQFPATSSFHQWHPQQKLQAGDTLVYAQEVNKFTLNSSHHKAPYPLSSSQSNSPILLNLFRNLTEGWKRKLAQWQNTYGDRWRHMVIFQGIQSIAPICTIITIVLSIVGTFVFKSYYPDLSWLDAFYATAILLLGGYGDLFGNLEPAVKIPAWLQLFSFSLTLVGTAFVGVLYALLTEALLSYKFNLLRRSPPIPQQNHLIVVGLDRLGQQVANFLQNLDRSLVGITLNRDFDRALLPGIPIIIGNVQDALKQANLVEAKSAIVATENEMLNLEIALMVRRLNPEIHLAIGTYSQGLSQYLNHLLHNVQTIATYEVAAEAFAGAAFGENIISLLRYNNTTILVTEYQIEAIDTLHGHLISEVAYGYGVAVILHQTPGEYATLMPSDDIRLAVGDRIVVLSSIDGLKHIEQGTVQSDLRCWYVRINSASTEDSVFDGANTISRVSGYHLSASRDLMNNLPQILPKPLYLNQAERLIHQLRRSRVRAELVED
ncbi:NAD-binding protein [Roseofilum casamattae]|uniref:NAD-binding protein n=1 Tax=Roseofilum casamattae BLCC-M143 TaxID=3022442 RepID=A0ABT7C0X6_9CYAN|nr:NAD-binding protein [Roseofilum casamattae]MDJ1184399.1 NAD-binding protein [Roseofilum casamattae BLCC-M143]